MNPWVERDAFVLDRRSTQTSLEALPEDLVASAQNLLRAVMNEIPAKAHILADAARIRTANRFHEEARAIARAVGVSWRDVMLAAVSYDLVLATIGCSTVLLATTSGPVLARNMDWWPEDLLARASAVVHYHEDGRAVFSHAGWPGQSS